ncbi:MFS transporter, DHA2 family, multidrug resistance protein [Desulfurella multipotens]|uniref:MFS transporter, DHA2 family, multidrug resistance protein n=1 Tax=Desulfurella multipotens TaxID=79269 RepID=A0A1G6I757_9BACT|nr:DHA2 family efflux MFS transporter permease subunit [Desulfurella multipotens]SDC02379.1 MFS transporter, DHA2 family, multidrug resistance protein [Desulfurella multipotens]
MNKWIVTITVMIGTIMSSLDTSIVNVAIPYIQGSMGASLEQITWVSTGYLLSNTIIMPIIALLSSRFGRKNFYMFGIALFTLGSALCGIAWNLYAIVIFRIIQGIGGGVLIPIAQAILREVFPKEEQGMAMGIYGMGVVMGPAIGPTLGGWLIDRYSWPWIFYINLPIGIVALIMVNIFIEDPEFLIREKSKIDFLGLIFMAIGFGTLQIFLADGENKDWFTSQYITHLAIIAGAGIIFFVIRELTIKKPAVDLRILKNINFTLGTLLGGVLGMGLFASLFVLPVFLQNLLGYTAFDAGVAMVPRSLAMALMMPIGGKLFNKLGPKILVSFGLILVIISFFQFANLNLNASFWDIFIPQFLQGSGFGFIFVSVSTSALITIEKSDLTFATSIYNVFRLITGSIGVALAATYVDRGTNAYYSVLTQNVSMFSRNTLEYIARLDQVLGIPFQLPDLKIKEMLNETIMQQAMMLSYNHVYLLIMFIFVLSLPLAFFLKGFKDIKRD